MNMAHYAFLDSDNKVTHVIVGRNETEVVDGISNWEAHYADVVGQRCVRTSYNNRIRKQYAGIGYTYSDDGDVFIAPQPFGSWLLDDNYDWQAPNPKPVGDYYWNESTLSWLAIPVG